MRIGLVVNPIAGMGGRFALKGSDDLELLAAARERGATPVAPARAQESLEYLARRRDAFELVTYAGDMGAVETEAAGLRAEVLGSVGEVTSAADTRSAVTAFAEDGVDLLLFAGGDGTAVDVFEAVASRVPVLGIPAGVKMHSAVFAVSPRSAGELALLVVEGGVRGVREAEVMDVDEADLRNGILSPRLHGYLSVPAERRLLQNAKARSLAAEGAAQEGIARHLVDHVLGTGTWFLGPGTTTRAVADALGLEKTLLGVDVVRARELVARDADEEMLLAYAAEGSAGIVVAPVGGQGFVFGRGNQQLSARVLGRIRPEGVVVAATEAKIAALGGRPLRVDTGDRELDGRLSGYRRVVVAYNREIVYRVAG
ncbi:MAG TPA: ATP-NAD kinase family protein [Gaiellaceae bacterium]